MVKRGGGDGKVYTFILRDEDEDEGKREKGDRAGVNWEVEFRALASPSPSPSPATIGEEKEEKEGEGQVVWFPWTDFKPTYRGREKKDAGELKTGEIRRVSIMMRRYVFMRKRVLGWGELC